MGLSVLSNTLLGVAWKTMAWMKYLFNFPKAIDLPNSFAQETPFAKDDG